jgi:hypothetical protein
MLLVSKVCGGGGGGDIAVQETLCAVPGLYTQKRPLPFSCCCVSILAIEKT